jgi:hypothetical protein
MKEFSMPKYRNCVFRDDSTTLQVLWLRAVEPALLVGIKDCWREAGLACFLTPPEATQFADLLDNEAQKSFVLHDQIKLRATPANRGEPFRKGMNITLTFEPDDLPEFIFLDEGDVADLVEFIRQGPPEASK